MAVTERLAEVWVWGVHNCCFYCRRGCGGGGGGGHQPVSACVGGGSYPRTTFPQIHMGYVIHVDWGQGLCMPHYCHHRPLLWQRLVLRCVALGVGQCLEAATGNREEGPRVCLRPYAFKSGAYDKATGIRLTPRCGTCTTRSSMSAGLGRGLA